jgi:hypothetical protein
MNRKNPLFEKIFHRLPPDISQTFTPAQQEALQQAIVQIKADRHPIDIRLSVPFLGKGFYLVILAGTERRSLKRLRAEDPYYILKAIGYLSGATLLAAIMIFALFWLTHQAAKPTSETSYPTAIPWIDNEAECHHTGRTWHEQKCWDSEWSHKF